MVTSLRGEHMRRSVSCVCGPGRLVTESISSDARVWSGRNHSGGGWLSVEELAQMGPLGRDNGGTK